MKNNGQVAIIVLLISAVMMTLGLTMSKNEVTEIKINTNDELLKKAFDTAESGINYYLGTGETKYLSTDNLSNAKVSVNKIAEGETVIDFNEYVPEGSTESYWLVDHLVDGSLGVDYFTGNSVNVCKNGTFTGSIEISYFYKESGVFKLKRYGFNYNSNPALQVTGFENTASDCVRIFTEGDPVLLAVAPIYSGGKFYVESLVDGANFPSQGQEIISEGSIDTQAKKKLAITQRYKIPGFMVSGIVAEGSIQSN